jgi:hypothetical protein
MRRKIKIIGKRRVKKKITLRESKKKDNVNFINIGIKSETNDKFY